MNYYYSKSTGGFYTEEIHGDKIPSDAVEITAEYHVELMQGQGEGKRIVADVDGYPVLADQPEPTPEEKTSTNKQKAVSLLAETDFVEVPSVTDTSTAPYLVNVAEFVAYRCALRVIAVYPTPDAVFPDKPEEIWR